MIDDDSFSLSLLLLLWARARTTRLDSIVRLSSGLSVRASVRQSEIFLRAEILSQEDRHVGNLNFSDDFPGAKTKQNITAHTRMEDDPRSPLLDEDDDLGASSAATSTLQAALSLVVSTAGGIGMVTLPGSVAKLGYLESALLLVFAGALSASSLAMLDWSRGVVGGRGRSPPTYADLVASALGRSGSRVLDVLTLLYCFGQIVSYLSAIGGQARAILGLAGVNLRTHEAIACSGIVLFPLALTPERLSMMVAGTLGTLCLSYIVAVVILGDGVRALATGGGPCSMAGGEGTSSDIRPEAFSSSWVALMKNAPIFL